jgi:hypothetical protein
VDRRRCVPAPNAVSRGPGTAAAAAAAHAGRWHAAPPSAAAAAAAEHCRRTHQQFCCNFVACATAQCTCAPWLGPRRSALVHGMKAKSHAPCLCCPGWRAGCGCKSRQGRTCHISGAGVLDGASVRCQQLSQQLRKRCPLVVRLASHLCLTRTCAEPAMTQSGMSNASTTKLWLTASQAKVFD